MPLYEYQCAQCNHRFEVRQSFHDDPLTTCPECGGAIRRVIHPVGIVFKGSGFYVNDSRNATSTARPAAAKSDEASQNTGRSSETGADQGAATSSKADQGGSSAPTSQETAPPSAAKPSSD